MIAILTIFYICGGTEFHEDCEYSIMAEYTLGEHEISEDAHQTFLEEHGWLLVGGLAYCPACRFELHD